MKKIAIIIVSLLSINFSYGQVIIGGNTVVNTVQYGVSLKGNGIISDADISFYSSSFGTDQTSAIQTILNTASATNPLYLIWDVKASCTGLRVKSYTTINALPGCGAILRDGSNKSLISNYNWTANSNNIVDSFITINGGIWNGNGWRGATQYQDNNNASNGQITVFNWFGVKNVVMQNFFSWNASSWNVLFITSENVYINNFVINDSIPHKIQDGLDFLGKAKNITVTNGRITNGDDRIVFCPNSTGGNTGTYNHTVYTGVDGDQTNIRVDHIFFDGVGKGFAIYNCGGNQLKDVFISNISGTSQTFWCGIFNQDMLGGYSLTTGIKYPININFENIAVDVPTNVGYGTVYPMCIISCSFNDIHFKNISRNNYVQGYPTIGFLNSNGSPNLTGKVLTIDGITSDTVPSKPTDQIMISGSNVFVNNLSVRNCQIDMGATKLDSSFLKIGLGATVNNLSLTNNNINSLKYVVKNYGTVTNGSVTQTIHTGQGGSDPSVYNIGTFTTLWMSNCIFTLSTSGTFTTKKGDAFL